MKKKVALLLLLCGLRIVSIGQSKAMEGVAEFQGKKVPAAVIEVPYSPDKVEDAIADKMASKGHKGSKAKDYQLYRSVAVGNDKTTYDVYIKTERKSRKDKESSVVYVVLVKPNEVASADNILAAGALISGKELLNDYSSHIVDYNLELEIADQQEIVTKLEKKQTSLLNDSTDLVIKSKQLEEKMLENSNNLLKQRTEIEKQRLTLEAIRSRKRN